MFNVFLFRQTSRSTQAAEAAARAARDSVRVARQTTQVEAFLQLLDRMEQTRKDRAAVRGFIKAKRPVQQLTKVERDSVDAVCRAFDILGYFDHQGMIDPTFVDHFYAIPLKELYDDYLEGYLDELRQNDRDKSHFWELVQLRKRVEHVRHPADQDLANWPARSRPTT
jgi:hypothetical protein